jgi:uroporphyrinogen-III synthase
LTAQARQVLGAHDPVIVPVFSPRSAKILCDQGPFSAPIHAVAMSEATGQPLRILGIARLEIAQTPDAVGMLDALGGILRHPDT